MGIKSAEHTRFGNALSELLQSKGVRVYELAKDINMQRTNVYKMLTGERAPASPDLVKKMSDVLLLSPAESGNLMQAWQIDTMGEDVYARRSMVASFFNTFQAEIRGKEQFPYSAMDMPQPYFPVQTAISTMPIMGIFQLEQAIRDLCYLEASRPNGYIRLFIQPDSSFLISLLVDIGQRYPGLQIDHLFCLENGQKEKNGLYNFSCLKVMLPAVLSGCRYNLRYYYDSVTSLQTAEIIQPFFILTSSGILTFSYDYSFGTMQTDPNILSMYSLYYDRFFGQCRDTFKVITSLPDILKFTTDHLNIRESSSLIMSQPCLIQYIPPEMVEKYMNQNLVTDEFRDDVNAYLEKVGTLLSNRTETCYFTREGILNFLENGLLDEIPDEYYKVFSPQDRKSIIKSLYLSCLSGQSRVRLLRTDRLSVVPRFWCYQIDDHGIIAINKPHGSYYTILLREQSIVYTIKDFFEFLPESDWMESEDTCLAFLKSVTD